MNRSKPTNRAFSITTHTFIALTARIIHRRNQPPRRALAMLLLAVLLAPLVLFGQPPPVAAANSVLNGGSSVPSVNAPPAVTTPLEAFAAPNAKETADAELAAGFALPYLLAAGNGLANGYRATTNFIAPPALPEGFDNAQLPTLRERAAALWSDSTADIAPIAETVEPLTPPPPTAPATARFDFDLDGKADVGRYQPLTNSWTIKRSGNGSLLNVNGFGTNGSVVASADYDGDGITDLAVWNQYSADWKIQPSATGPNGQPFVLNGYGANGDRVVSADYDGDGKADIALFRPSNGTWYVCRSSNGQTTSVQFGQAGDVPVVGNYDGDGLADYAVFRPSSGTWYVQPGSGGFSAFQWGLGSDIPVPADYTGDGKTDYAVYRPSTGTWYVQPNGGGNYFAKTWGNYGDQPVAADYDGDGTADISVWRPTNGIWYIVKSSIAGQSTYQYDQLGVLGDVAVPSAYYKQIGSSALTYDLANARLHPKNATSGATDLYSRNVGWSGGLVSLPGRANLDAGFGISYNSLVWTKESASNTVVFDADHSNITPGFRFGFPVVEPGYYNALTEKYSYLMVLPSGSRVEFRQTAASNVYEAADSSYAQLTVIPGGITQGIEGATLVVKTTDGTQMTYLWRAGSYRLAEIKDRNGNFITVVHDSQYGLLRSMTDTLGRVVSVEYDADFCPTAIKQDWQSNNGAGSTVAHTYATFVYGYQAINPSFALGINVYGPTNGAYVKVLQALTYADGTAMTFNYNDYGQVYKIRNLAADGHELNYTRTDLQTPVANQTDCPRFATTYQKIENFNNNQETVIHNTWTPNQNFVAGGETLGPSDVAEAWLDGDPHQIHTKTYYHTAGNWSEGLPFGSEDITDEERQRWTRTVWTQDDLNKNYKVNPRVTESKVGDNTNIKRTILEYLPIAQNSPVAKFGLVSKIEIYDGAANTLLKRMTTDYNSAATYINRRIIGLPQERKLYDEIGNLMARTTYAYDGGDFTGTEQNISAGGNPVIQHDNANFGANLIAGRGNPTSATRYDVAGQISPITSSVKYNTAGAAVSQITPGSTTGVTREVKVSYMDAFNDNLNTRNTYAYPTKLTDPASNYSQVKYRFDLGANVWAKSPDPNTTATGKTTTRNYDDQGRLERETLVNSGAYTRYEYPAIATQSKVYTTVNDTNGNGADAADEILSESLTDGVGRMLWSRTAHPGSTGGWSATRTEYDLLGQVKRASVPTEVNSAWQLAGDGATRGWLWKSQEYDWKGRTTKVTETDGTFKTLSYDGCGCAGGEIVTIEGEQLADGKRKQRIYSDILGRQYKTEILNWDGSVYSTNVTKFNGRDQADWNKQLVGAASAATLLSDACPIQPAGEAQTCQITKMTYDGYARLKTQHAPQQDANKATSFEYYPNGELQRTTDARGATATYNYNNRGLVTNIDYAMPPSASAATGSGGDGPPDWCEEDDACCLDPDDCPLPTSSPIGFLDSVNPANGLVRGWSLDRDDPSASNTVHIYIDGGAGSGGTQIGTVTANLPRPDVNAGTEYSGDHGFEFTLPNQYLNGASHTIYAYGIDTGSDGSSMLSGSPKSVSYSPNTVQPPLNSSLSFDYDAVGNRLWMTDNLGRTDYEYDGLSRLKSETRKFTDTTQNGSPLVMANAPLPNNGFKLQYTYGLANQLTSLTDPFGAVVNYAYDPAGRLDNVTGSSFGNVTTYANNAEYQAWGGLKKLNYGAAAANVQMTMGYNNRLQANNYQLTGGGQDIMKKNYDYYADGSLKYVQDALNPKFDRLNIYDQIGRIKEGKTGLEARSGDTVTPSQQSENLPYRQSYQFNAFNNLTVRNNLHWGIDNWYGQSNNLNYDYKNTRIQGAAWEYDADGRNLQSAAPDEFATSVYNAMGQMVRSQTGQTDAVRLYDGNGREIKRTTANYEGSTGDWIMQPIKYYVRSSVLGNETVSEVWANGKKGKTFVNAAGSQIAYQSAYASDTAALSEAVIFEYTDASGMSQRTTDRTGAAVATGDGGDGSPVETDPLGNNVGTYTPYVEEPIYTYNPEPQYPMLQSYFDDAPFYINGQQASATLDGFPISRTRALQLLDNGSAIPAALAAFQGLPGFSFQSHGSGIFTVSIPRQVGWNVTYNGANDTRGTASPVYSGNYNFTLSYNNVSWSPRQQQMQPVSQHEQQQVQQQPKKDRPYDRQRLKDCIRDYYHVETSQIDDDGSDAEFSFSGTYTAPGIFWGEVIKEMEVTTSSSEYSLGQLGFYSGGRPYAYGLTIRRSWLNYLTWGYGKNYVASEFKDALNIAQRTWVYELGNALAQETRVFPPMDAKDKKDLPDDDVGAVLEKCVYGSYIADKTAVKTMAK